MLCFTAFTSFLGLEYAFIILCRIYALLCCMLTSRWLFKHQRTWGKLKNMSGLKYILTFNIVHWNEHHTLFSALFRIDVVKIFCTSIFKYVQDVSNAGIMSKTLGLLAEMLKW